MLDAKFIPDTATLREQKNGVVWYSLGEGVNSLHYIQFEGRILQGAWGGPQWVFWAVSSMPAEERATYLTHDAFMGAIRRRLAQRQRESGGQPSNQGEQDLPYNKRGNACFPKRNQNTAWHNLDDLENEAHLLGYRLTIGTGGLLLYDRELSHLFANTAQGRQELAEHLLYLKDKRTRLIHGSPDWERWAGLPGIQATWTDHLYEHWPPDAPAYTDLRQFQAQDGQRIWVERRALLWLGGTLEEILAHRFYLVTSGSQRAIRAEKEGGPNRYRDARNPASLPFFPVAVFVEVVLPELPDGQAR